MATRSHQARSLPLANLVTFLFFLSGACALIYEIVWVRMLTVVFGTTMFAVSTVLSAFMAGLALGSFAFGRWSDRWRYPLRIFAALQAGIGLFALLFPGLTEALNYFFGEIYPAGGGSFAFLLLRFLFCFLTLLLPTVLMGATLPVVIKFSVRHLPQLGRGVGGLYAANTFGAVVGILAVTFVLMERLGLQASTQAAAAGNFLIGALAWYLGRDLAVEADENGKPPPTASRKKAGEAPERPVPPLVLRLVLLGFALSGFAALGYEVAWTRLLSVAFSINSHYEFSIILTAFLLGLALGSYLCSRLLDRWSDLLSLFGGVQIAIGLLAILSIPVIAALPGVVDSVKRASSWWGLEASIFAVSAGIMLVPTLLMGATFPLAGRLYTRALRHLGQSIGDVSAVNSVGAIGGSFATGFLLIPALGTEWSIKTLALLNLSAGLAVVAFHPFLTARRKQTVCAGALLALLALVLLVPSDVLRRISQNLVPRAELAHYAEGASGVVTVHRTADGFRELKVNGGGQVPSDYSSVQLFRLLGHLPLLLHPDPQDALVVAFGGGITLGSISRHDLHRIECVEIVPEVLDAARVHFGEFNHRILENLEREKVRIIIDDGRNYLRSRKQPYDIITGDATHPTSADSWVLYTREFYELCRDRLRDDGIMAQWLPIHGLSVDDYKTILRTVQSVFPHATLWMTNDYTLIVAPRRSLRFDLSILEEKLTAAKTRKSLEQADLGDVPSLLGCFFMDEKALRQYVGEGPLNTDNHPHISFAGPRSFRMKGWEVLADLAPHRMRAWPLLSAGDRQKVEEADLEAYFTSRKHVLRGDVFRMQRRGSDALKEYRKALAANLRDRTAAHFARMLSGPIVEQYQRRLDAHPGDLETLWKLGNIFAGTGRVEEAEETFEKIIARAPENLNAHLSLAYLYAQHGRAEKAEEIYRRAVAIAPDSDRARASLKAAWEKIKPTR